VVSDVSDDYRLGQSGRSQKLLLTFMCCPDQERTGLQFLSSMYRESIVTLLICLVIWEIR
jgi:hypothetical protein